MRKFFLGVTLAALGFALSAGWSHATDIRVIAGEITSTFKSTQALPEYLRTVPTELTPGLRVYSEGGDFLGTLSAFSHSEGEVTRVWFGNQVASGKDIIIENGRVVFSTDIEM